MFNSGFKRKLKLEVDKIGIEFNSIRVKKPNDVPFETYDKAVLLQIKEIINKRIENLEYDNESCYYGIIEIQKIIVSYLTLNKTTNNYIKEPISINPLSK